MLATPEKDRPIAIPLACIQGVHLLQTKGLKTVSPSQSRRGGQKPNPTAHSTLTPDPQHSHRAETTEGTFVNEAPRIDVGVLLHCPRDAHLRRIGIPLESTAMVHVTLIPVEAEGDFGMVLQGGMAVKDELVTLITLPETT